MVEAARETSCRSEVVGLSSESIVVMTFQTSRSNSEWGLMKVSDDGQSC